MPKVGKYNPGQKLFFLTIALFGLLMVISGFIIWFPSGFAKTTVQWLFALHALGFVVIFAFFLVHLYLVTIGAPGSASAMLSGWVTRGWIKTQHPKWLEEMEKEGKLVVCGGSEKNGKTT